MQQDHTALTALADEIEASLAACVRSWENYEDELKQMTSWLTSAEQKLASKKEVKIEPAAQQQQYREFEVDWFYPFHFFNNISLESAIHLYMRGNIVFIYLSLLLQNC